MARKVKGTLFVDYVRMIRSRKHIDWRRHLEPGDLAYLQRQIQPDAWYPMETFERFGLAILAELADGNLEAARTWGELSLDDLRRHHPDLVVAGDPRESLMRVKVLRASLFDFEAVAIRDLRDGEARIRVDYGMQPAAEEAAAHQTLGVFERLIVVSGGQDCRATLASRSWLGDSDTIIELRWS